MRTKLRAVAGKVFVRGKFVRKRRERRESVKFIIDVDPMKPYHVRNLFFEASASS